MSPGRQLQSGFLSADRTCREGCPVGFYSTKRLLTTEPPRVQWRASSPGVVVREPAQDCARVRTSALLFASVVAGLNILVAGGTQSGNPTIA